MNVIYKPISNSILRYIKLQGKPADKPYLILRIHYFNILGVIDSIDILKEVSIGQKIISTKPKQTKTIVSTDTLPKTKKKSIPKETDLFTRHTKLGLITPLQWERVKTTYSKILKSKMAIMEKYCTSYTKHTGITPFFSLGDGPANIYKSSKELPYKNSNGFLLYAGCDLISSAISKSETTKKGLKITTNFSSLYQIFPNSKTVLRIQNCDEFTNLYSKYSKDNKIDWKTIMKEYDGILIENIECNSSKKPNYNKLLSEILSNKILTSEVEKNKIQLASNKLQNIGFIWNINKSKFVKVI